MEKNETPRNPKSPIIQSVESIFNQFSDHDEISL